MQKGNAYQCSETENDGMQMRQLRNAETAVPYPKGGWLFFCFRTVPSLLRRKYHADRMPVRGLIRGRFFFGCKIAALNFKKLFTFQKGLGHYAQNPALA